MTVRTTIFLGNVYGSGQVGIGLNGGMLAARTSMGMQSVPDVLRWELARSMESNCALVVEY